MSVIANLINSKSENPFWDFSVDAYQQAGVENLCLQLQDEHQLNVNFVLYCCWLGKQSIRVDAAEISLLVKELRFWDSEVVSPLRSARRALETLKADSALVLRKEVSSCELSAEKIFQEHVYRFAESLIEQKQQAQKIRQSSEQAKPLTLENIHSKKDLAGVRQEDHKEVEFRRFTEFATYNLGQYCDAIGRTKTLGLKKAVSTLVGLLDE